MSDYTGCGQVGGGKNRELKMNTLVFLGQILLCVATVPVPADLGMLEVITEEAGGS